MENLIRLSLLALFSITLFACNEESKEKTVYDYLVNKPLLDSDMQNCISGKENNVHKCDIVKSAYNRYNFFEEGLYSEKDLKEFGKK